MFDGVILLSISVGVVVNFTLGSELFCFSVLFFREQARSLVCSSRLTIFSQAPTISTISQLEKRVRMLMRRGMLLIVCQFCFVCLINVERLSFLNMLICVLTSTFLVFSGANAFVII